MTQTSVKTPISLVRVGPIMIDSKTFRSSLTVDIGAGLRIATATTELVLLRRPRCENTAS